jgi:hypothetical protein
MVENSRLKITLTDRAPIAIKEDDWPIIASADVFEHDGEVEAQSNRRTRWELVVRQHEDARAIVYATYSYDSNWQNERGYDVRGGELLADSDELAAAIKRVGRWMELEEHDEQDSKRWEQLINDCIGDLPEQEID